MASILLSGRAYGQSRDLGSHDHTKTTVPQLAMLEEEKNIAIAEADMILCKCEGRFHAKNGVLIDSTSGITPVEREET
jgi:hypothetical protein